MTKNSFPQNRIEINSQITKTQQEEQTTFQAAQTVLDYFRIRASRVSILLTDDATIQVMNRTFRGIDRPTDVLSFAAREGEILLQGKGYEFLGDIAVSVETAKRQADEYGQTRQRELAFLVVHGMLHLLGYDHMEAEEEEEMREKQRVILNLMRL